MRHRHFRSRFRRLWIRAKADDEEAKLLLTRNLKKHIAAEAARLCVLYRNSDLSEFLTFGSNAVALVLRNPKNRWNITRPRLLQLIRLHILRQADLKYWRTRPSRKGSWARMVFRRIWTAAAAGDGHALESLLAYYRPIAQHRAAAFARSHPSVPAEELPALVDALLRDVVGRQLRLRVPRPDLVLPSLQRKLSIVDRVTSIRRPDSAGADGGPASASGIGFLPERLQALLEALAVPLETAASVDLDRWTRLLGAVRGRDGEIFRARFDPALKAPPASLRQVAGELGISRARVGQILERALWTLLMKAADEGMVPAGLVTSAEGTMDLPRALRSADEKLKARPVVAVGPWALPFRRRLTSSRPAQHR